MSTLGRATLATTVAITTAATVLVIDPTLCWARAGAALIGVLTILTLATTWWRTGRKNGKRP
jgi:hypothetical protein